MAGMETLMRCDMLLLHCAPVTRNALSTETSGSQRVHYRGFVGALRPARVCRNGCATTFAPPPPPGVEGAIFVRPSLATISCTDGSASERGDVNLIRDLG